VGGWGVGLAGAGGGGLGRGGGGGVAGGVAGPPSARRVVLHLDAATWECDCPGPDDPCEHVAAAAIAWHRAREDNRALPSADEGGIRYALSRARTGLALERQVVCGEMVTRLEVGLRALLAGRVPGPRVLASARDLDIEAELDSPLPGPLPRARPQPLPPQL